MAAYAAAVTSPMRKPQRVSESLYVYHGQINVTNYNSTLAEITGITGKFRGTPTVVLSGISESGYLCHWDPTTEAVKCFYPNTAHQHQQAITTGSTTAADSTSGTFVEDSAAAETALVAMGLAVDTTVDIGNTVANTAAAGGEVANDVDVGLVYFTAFGFA